MPLIGRILIVEDDADTRTVLAETLRAQGYEVETAVDGFRALEKLEAFKPQLMLSDLRMPGLDGISLLKRVREIASDVSIVFLTGSNTATAAVSAIRQGAADYLVKPVDPDHLLAVVERELRLNRLRDEAKQLREELSERGSINNIVGASSAVMQPMCNTIRTVAPSRVSVLIRGESGTGKELVAAAIHELSPRRRGPFIKVHCAALAESLLESELFGHEKGAFTGAAARHPGRFERAHRGTLFLDEIGEISPSVQVKLLRFLQEREFERVGGTEMVNVDVRVIAATNRDLMKEVHEGRFREDLFYRLAVVSIATVPLRDMRSNIPAIAMHVMRRFSAENGKTVAGFSDDALSMLDQHSWPGNVRELENAVERGVLCCHGDLVQAADLGITVEAELVHAMPRVPGASLDELERFAVLKTMEHTGGSTSIAAGILGISQRKLQYRLEEYGDVETTRVSTVDAEHSPLNQVPPFSFTRRADDRRVS